MSEKKLLLIFFGMIATGKSHLAAAFAKKWGCAYHNSDIVRKELAGLAADSRQINTVDTGIYSSEFSPRTYEAVLARAQNHLKQKRYACVVLDGS
jgi:predicted kinase